MSGKRIFSHCFFVALVVFAADRITKYLVTLNIPVGDSVPNQEAFIRLYHTLNDGVAFSMLAGQGASLIIMQSVIVAVIIGIVIIGYRRILSASRPLIIMTSFSFMLGGGVGNLVDRIATGKVTDFVSIGSFAVFNVADAFLTSGCGLLILYVLLYSGKEPDSGSGVDAGSEFGVNERTGTGFTPGSHHDTDQDAGTGEDAGDQPKNG